MANTFTSLHYHVVFSTKNRKRSLVADIEERVWSYLGGVARANGVIPAKIGGVEDHIHALLTAPATLSLSRMVQVVKGESSRWIHREFPRLRKFAWQDGYAAFTVSRSSIPQVVRYIENQREHHRKRTFQEEYVELLEMHGIVYDDKFLWG